MDINVKDFKKEINKAKGIKSRVVDYDEAFDLINNRMTDTDKLDLIVNKQNNTKETD